MIEVSINDIIIGERRTVSNYLELARSIKEIGLINPVTINKDNKLIAGYHRIKAFEYLGIDKIPARVIDCDALQAELVEIDENLIRNELTELEQGIQFARRKSIYLELHPYAKAGVAGGLSGGRGRPKIATDIMSFANDAAIKTGKSSRTVDRKVAVGEALSDIQNEIISAGLEDSQCDLVELVKIKNKNPDVVSEILDVVKTGKAKNVKAAVRQISIAKQIDDIERGNISEPTGLYDVISIDPPWKYEEGENNSYDSEGRRVANPYPEMTLQQIANLSLPIKENAVIWLWTTHKYLKDSFGLLDQWGFSHKATLVWDKEQMGMGRWLRMQCEFCLLAIKGNPVWENTKVRDILREKRREHSRKPEGFYQMVDDICVGRKMDYFSREKRDGWDNFGNDNKLFNV